MTPTTLLQHYNFRWRVKQKENNTQDNEINLIWNISKPSALIWIYFPLNIFKYSHQGFRASNNDFWCINYLLQHCFFLKTIQFPLIYTSPGWQLSKDPLWISAFKLALRRATAYIFQQMCFRRLMSKSFNNSELRAAVSWCSKQVLVHFQKCKHWAEITLGEECVQQLYLSSPQPQCRAWRSEEPCISRAHTASPGCSQTLDLWSNIRWTHKCILMLDLVGVFFLIVFPLLNALQTLFFLCKSQA